MKQREDVKEGCDKQCSMEKHRREKGKEGVTVCDEREGDGRREGTQRKGDGKKEGKRRTCKETKRDGKDRWKNCNFFENHFKINDIHSNEITSSMVI